jgi:hypothetical protein
VDITTLFGKREEHEKNQKKDKGKEQEDDCSNNFIFKFQWSRA